MKVLIVTGPIYPSVGNNANLIGKIVPQLKNAGHELAVLSVTDNPEAGDLPESIFGCKTYWVGWTIKKTGRRLLYHALAYFADHNGFSDLICELAVKDEIRTIHKKWGFEAIISTCQPFYAASVSARIANVKRIVYLMDPPEIAQRVEGTPYRNKRLSKMLKKQTRVLTTPFIHQALTDNAIIHDPDHVVEVGFPMIENHSQHDGGAFPEMNHEKINLLFCGWMCSSIRSPAYFLKLAEVLDDRFCIWFMGKECDRVAERFSFHTEAEVRTLPQQPYAIALAAMAQADILINIGNSVPVHMPSKTLEYINTGKPFVNFYKMDDCPTLYYTKRYPLCLNLFEGEQDVDAAKQQFLSFCLEQQGKTVERSRIEAEFPDCTPRYIGEKIMEALQ